MAGGLELRDAVPGFTVPRALIAETSDLVAVLSGRGSARRLAELARVEGLGPDGDYRINPAIQTSTGESS